jgi:cytoskeletal protein CcmA (bactofilin family)
MNDIILEEDTTEDLFDDTMKGIILEEGTTEDILDDTMKDDLKEDIADQSILADDGTLDIDIYDDMNEKLFEKEILEEGLEDEVEDMSEKVDLKADEIDEVNVDDFDENIDLDLLDALNAEEEQDEENKKKPDKKLRAASVVDDDDVTVISKGTTINGSISSDGSLDIMGNISGDIECLGKLSITGKIVGNSTAAEVYINTERLEGSINSEGSVKVGLGTVVVGDIVATSGVIAGAVKGEIDVNGPIVIDSTAIIKGNIKAKSVQINNGAVVEGFCSLSYSDVDLDNVFE